MEKQTNGHGEGRNGRMKFMGILDNIILVVLAKYNKGRKSKAFRNEN